ncbi:hypothetical protein Lalb_Chr08g0234561 [Lupinus albus]|uniref:Uncharacterized protein n=1 Tax=Lupinus albus TaxID=3870 RepID=A0A6A4Q437_LUPAL|nr:hypothetical protein Lalb_Chr08g0234561 [Lupinus albus]
MFTWKRAIVKLVCRKLLYIYMVVLLLWPFELSSLKDCSNNFTDSTHAILEQTVSCLNVMCIAAESIFTLKAIS